MCSQVGDLMLSLTGYDGRLFLDGPHLSDDEAFRGKLIQTVIVANDSLVGPALCFAWKLEEWTSGYWAHL